MNNSIIHELFIIHELVNLEQFEFSWRRNIFFLHDIIPDELIEKQGYFSDISQLSFRSRFYDRVKIVKDPSDSIKGKIQN